MPVVERVIVQQPLTCAKCGKPLNRGKIAIKNRIKKGVVVHLHVRCYAKQNKGNLEEE